MELSKQSSNIEPLLDKAVTTLSSLHILYEKANNKTKREIIGSIFPEKLVFDGMHYRTARLNEAVSLIYKLGNAFSENKNGQNGEKIELSNLVTRPGFEPRQSESEYGEVILQIVKPLLVLGSRFFISPDCIHICQSSYESSYNF